jgi:hypothetical protein
MGSLPRWLRMAAAGLVAFLATGCHAAFEKQTIYAAFPKDRDEIRALLVYEGIHVHHSKNFQGDDVTLAKKELAGFVAEQEFCLLGGWPLQFNLAPEMGDSDATRKEKELLRKHLTIRNGAFYTRADGKLCAYQYLTVRDASRFVTGINGMISDSVLAEISSESRILDRESQEMIRRAARDGHAWLKLEPGRLRADVPMTPASVRRLKHELLEVDRLSKLREALNPDKPKPAAPGTELELWATVKGLRDAASFGDNNPWSFEQRRDRVLISLGVGDGEPLRVESPTDQQGRKPTKEDAELAGYVRTLPVKFGKDVTVESLIEAFAKQDAGTKKPEK